MMMMMGVVVVIRVEQEEKKTNNYACKHPHTHLSSCRSWDESLLVVAVTFLSLVRVFLFFLGSELFIRRKKRRKKRAEEENGRRKIVHPIGDARGCGEFCRLACTSLYDALGHDWSKTENEQI